MCVGRTFFTVPQVRPDYDEYIGYGRFLALLRKRHISRTIVISCVLGSFCVACSSSAVDVCSQAVSVPSFTSRFIQGLDNFGEDQYENLRVDSTRARQTVVRIVDLFPDDKDAATVLQKIDEFILAMEIVNWDVSRALESPEANAAANSLGNNATISEANQIDALVIGLCGLPSTFVPNDATSETLPMPWIPSPTATEPETNLVDDTSETYALGLVVGTLFALTLSDEQVQCLGQELVGVVDRSDATANTAQYQTQFQRAFDNCSINFIVPSE